MKASWVLISLLCPAFISSCANKIAQDGLAVETQILASNNLSKDYGDNTLLRSVISDINCADSVILRKRLVLADSYHSVDTSEILLIPFLSNGVTFKSSAYSDIDSRYILINPAYIRDFALKNTLNDSTSFRPVIELMLLHEIGHFILKKPGAFDVIGAKAAANTGGRRDDTQPEFITQEKKVELSADSLAIDIIKRNLKLDHNSCLGIALEVELVIPGMQFQLSGTRMIEKFGAKDIGFLHDPSSSHPNMELRVTYMNYFLNPNDSLHRMIDDYIYNGTVAPVHRQEFEPMIFQGQEKSLPPKK